MILVIFDPGNDTRVFQLVAWSALTSHQLLRLKRTITKQSIQWGLLNTTVSRQNNFDFHKENFLVLIKLDKLPEKHSLGFLNFSFSLLREHKLLLITICSISNIFVLLQLFLHLHPPLIFFLTWSLRKVFWEHNVCLAVTEPLPRPNQSLGLSWTFSKYLNIFTKLWIAVPCRW